MTVPYAELHCLSNFSFLRGASHPEELVERAYELGYEALAITDECSVAGAVRAHLMAKKLSLKLIVGSEFLLEDGLKLVVLATNRKGYGHLCELITQGRRSAKKGEYHVERAFFANGLPGCLVLWVPQAICTLESALWVKQTFTGRAWVAIQLLAEEDDLKKLKTAKVIANQTGLPLVASGDVHMHSRSRRSLQDTITAIRLKSTLNKVGRDLYPNGERHLRSKSILASIYPENLLLESCRIAGRCDFSLEELRYEYPKELSPSGEDVSSYLRRLTFEGIERRWPEGAPQRVLTQVEHELKLIQSLRYEPFFLTVYDVVRFAREKEILCQGRGSAANSTVCFCLGITEVDPARMSLLFERFISKERNEPPDIDVDFEHERREEVIQYIYQKYGRHRTALAAAVVSYRPRSAIRDVGKALGLDALQVDRLARTIQWWDSKEIKDERIREAGFDPNSPAIQRLMNLVREILGFPRHLSQHVGGFVMSEGPLSQLVPIENAAMDDRTVIQWDKDDLEALGLLKVDVLALGMLTAIRRSFDLIREFRGEQWSLASIPPEDPAVYEMISNADTVGVFQIESRAQMQMLPRLRPQNYYDLVIEVAIIRPGPIQGDMVHPFLRRRNGEEPVSYPSTEVKKVLERTLGVPIFQEQVMHLAMVAAGFSAGEADQLRRAMAAWKRKGGLGPFETKLKEGMSERGYDPSFADRIFKQIKGFGEYGFPESHAASFALLVYVSAWLKHYEPAAFTAALLNSQPMGFYAPAQLVQMAKRHHVPINPVDVCHSDWDCSLEKAPDQNPVLRLGLRMVKGLSEEGAQSLVEQRSIQPFVSIQDLSERAGLNRKDLESLAAAGAFAELAGNRHQAVWQVAGVEEPAPLFDHLNFNEAVPLLRPPTEGSNIVSDYQNLGLSLGRHPLELIRSRLDKKGIVTAADLWSCPNQGFVKTAGLVITRQRPGTASGVIFVTLEDETGNSNLIIWQHVAQRYRTALLNSKLMVVYGHIQKQDGVLHVIVQAIWDNSSLLGRLNTRSRDFH